MAYVTATTRLFTHFLLLICFVSNNAWSRGGCFEKGTLIEAPQGSIAIERLKVGDSVYSRDGTHLQIAQVVATTQVHPKAFIDIQLPKQTLHVTDEHLLATELGVYRKASRLTSDDTLIIWENHHWQATKIISIKKIHTHNPAYNILVDKGSNYLANHVLAHNKGCFLPETPILLANNTQLAISQIHPGEQVKAFDPDGKVVTTVVRNVIKHMVTTYYSLVTDKVILHVTGEHPFYIGNGTFKTVEHLKKGDVIYGYADHQLSHQRIISIEKMNAKTMVYNLQTDTPHTYFAAGIAVHNKGGGCFTAGTKIRTPKGSKSIELLAPGDSVISIDHKGRKILNQIKSIFATRSKILTLVTKYGELHTTDEHPIAINLKQFVRADQLHVGNAILIETNDQLILSRISAIKQAPEQLVFNLETHSPHTYIADGVVVHNKGGHGGGGGGNQCGVNDYECNKQSFLIGIVIFMMAIIVCIVKVLIEQLQKPSRSDVRVKTKKTQAILHELAMRDEKMQPELLLKTARELFLKLQACWSARDYTPMEQLIVPELYRKHCVLIADMIKRHEINKMPRLHINQIDLVDVRQDYSLRFIALFTATTADFYVDDRTNKFLRGEVSPTQFQEFWEFKWSDLGWQLMTIYQADQHFLFL